MDRMGCVPALAQAIDRLGGVREASKALQVGARKVESWLTGGALPSGEDAYVMQAGGLKLGELLVEYQVAAAVDADVEARARYERAAGVLMLVLELSPAVTRAATARKGGCHASC